MLPAALITLSLLAAYVLVVALMSFSTFVFVSIKPGLAVQDLRLRAGYNLLQEFFWLVFSTLGGYVVVAGTTDASPRFAAALLVIALLFVIWTNKAEARQRGIIHTLLMSGCIMAGVVGGYILRMMHLSK